MSNIMKAAIIQLHCIEDKEENLKKTIGMIEEAASKGAKIMCLQEVFNTLYFPQTMDPKFYDLAEPLDGPTVRAMQEVAKKNEVVIVVPFYEKTDCPGVYYNTAAVVDADGRTLGIYRKSHIPLLPLFYEKFYFKPGNLGYPVFQTAYGNIGVYICYDRHFPEGARILGLKGAELIVIPTATIGSYQYLWEIELPAHAVANGCYVAGINRVGVEGQMNFYGSSFFSNPRGKIIAKASDKESEIVIADLDRSMIKEVRDLWQFFRDRRPETYLEIVQLLP
ncbi:MAG: carbon-nitrogen hydrolase [Chloroflexi bacterium]|nr:carbon-nitrogen hydrolase [Chloroflexota bacterium]